jgi:hypothetical protein
VLTHTRPFPPPGAGVAPTLAAALVFVEPMVVAAAGEGDGLIELLGLKKSASVFFAGDGDGVTAGATAAVVFPLRACFAAGEGDAAVAAAGEGEVAAAAVFFVLRVRFSAGEGDAAVASAGEALLVAAGAAALVVSAFL